MNVSRAPGDEPTLISALIRFACKSNAVHEVPRVMAQGEASEEELAALQAALVQDVKDPFLVNGLRGERAGTDLFLESVGNGKIPYDEIWRIDGTAGHSAFARSFLIVLGPVIGGSIKSNRAMLLEEFTRSIEFAEAPLDKQRVEFHKAQSRFAHNMNSFPRIGRLFVPATYKVLEASHRLAAQSNCLIVAIAAERIRLKNGRWPGSLQELSAEFFSEMPIDPYSGGPIRMEAAQDGLVSYSFGLNEVDDGGSIGTEGTAKVNEADLGIRLWNPEKRAVPAQAWDTEDEDE